ncbi:Rha family transcriptional regulator [Shewanella sp.]|uniref:Rha family transcriptional regulator n=1 Tax=Shewanella sp. TaxID=50422 RepID=UPI003F2F30DC
MLIRGNQAKITTLNVAEYFGKRRAHVLEKIEKLGCSSKFTSANFTVYVQQVSIGNGASRESKAYEMTKDGFMFLVMGFSGAKAASI